MAQVCGRLSSLSKMLTPAQLMIIMKATIRPMIQVNTVTKFLDAPTTSKEKMELPNDIGERVSAMMILGPEAKDLKKRKKPTVQPSYWQ